MKSYLLRCLQKELPPLLQIDSSIQSLQDKLNILEQKALVFQERRKELRDILDKLCLNTSTDVEMISPVE